jgi:hypothetical protein
MVEAGEWDEPEFALYPADSPKRVKDTQIFSVKKTAPSGAAFRLRMMLQSTLI